MVEESGNKNKETNKFKNNPPIKNRFFPKSKKTINKFFIIFSVILSLVLGNEIKKSYPFYKVVKKVPESKKSNSKIIKIEQINMDTLIELEKKINSELTTKINSSEIKYDQIYLEIDKEDLIDVTLFLKTNKNTKFRQLIDITAVDYPEKTQRFKLVYLFLSH